MSTSKKLAMELYLEELEIKLKISNINTVLLEKIINKLGIAAYDIRSDAATVTSGDQTKLDRVINNLLIKQLELENNDENLSLILNKAIDKYGKSNSTKYRVVLYYLIITNLKMEEKYLLI